MSRNVAHGRRRRLPSVTPARTALDRAEHIAALLDAAGALDKAARRRHGQRRALLATLVFAGLRIGEALALNWSDVDLARNTIKVRASKTMAADRQRGAHLAAELAAYATQAQGTPDALVFGTSNGKPHHRSQIRSRILAKAVQKANERLAEAKTEPLPSGLTLHSLRRTFASLLFAIGETPPYVMAQMGHTTAGLTLAVYAREMARRDGEPERFQTLVEGANWQRIGSSSNVVNLPDRKRRVA